MVTKVVSGVPAKAADTLRSDSEALTWHPRAGGSRGVGLAVTVVTVHAVVSAHVQRG
jgi:hypothetical protein